MKTMEIDCRYSTFDMENAQAQESEYFCHRGEPARRFSTFCSVVMTDKDIDDLSREIAEWSFDSETETVEKKYFMDCMLDWVDCCMPVDGPAYLAIFTLARDEIYESYTKWMDIFRREYCIYENEEDGEVDE